MRPGARLTRRCRFAGRCRLACLAFLAASLCVPAAGGAEALKAFPKAAWERVHEEAGLFCRLQALAASKDGECLLAIQALDVKGGSSGGRVFIRRTDAKGEAACEMTLEPPAGPGTPSAAGPASGLLYEVKSLAFLSGGGALAAVEHDHGKPRLLRLDRACKQVSAHDLTVQSRRSAVRAMAPSGEKDCFIVAGHDGFDLMAQDVDAAGAPRWREVSDLGKTDLYVAAVPDGTGGCILVGNSGDYDALGNGPSQVVVDWLDATGKRTARRTFPGRHGGVARSARSEVLVVYDRSAALARDIRVKAFDPERNEAADFGISSSRKGGGTYRIATLGGDGFLVAGGKDLRAYAVKVDARGRKLWEVLDESRYVTDAVDLASSGDGLLIAAPVLADAETTEARQVVLLTKVAGK